MKAFKGEKDRWHHTTSIRSGAKPYLRISKKFNLNFIETKKFDKLCTLADTDHSQYLLSLTSILENKKIISKARAEAIAEGIAEGIAEAKADVARRMLSNGLDVEIISLFTELTPEEVTKLANSTAQ